MRSIIVGSLIMRRLEFTKAVLVLDLCAGEFARSDDVGPLIAGDANAERDVADSHDADAHGERNAVHWPLGANDFGNVSQALCDDSARQRVVALNE